MKKNPLFSIQQFIAVLLFVSLKSYCGLLKVILAAANHSQSNIFDNF